VAVKVVRCQSEERFEIALEEGKLGMSMAHPNIVRVRCLGVS
jgi:hypothetical protein